MPRLVLAVEGGALAGREFSLEQGQLTIGRDESSGVRFADGENQVSRRHARIEVDGTDFRIVDQQSRNGTQVNQQRIAASFLKSGDVIELGQGGPRLRVRIEAPAPAPSETMSGPAPKRSFTETSLYDPTKDKGRRYPWLSILVILGMVSIGGFLGLLLALMTGLELGLGTALVGVMVAFFPAPVYLAMWLWLDRYDPEPAWILAGCLIWGGGAATFVSSIVNTVFGAVVTSVTHNAGIGEFVSASISAPFVEEGTKGLAVLVILLVFRSEFDGVIDGIVYAGVVALGFATVENVLYYGRITAKAGAGGLIFVFILRGILGPFSHSVFTSMTGIGCGIARQSHNTLVRLGAPLGGYLAAVFLHSLWNTLAGLVDGPLAFLAVYLLIWVPLFLAFFALTLLMAHRESRLIRRKLELEVATGLISAEQADIAGSWLRRVRWLLSSLRDFKRLTARRHFLYAATRLALCYDHVERATAAGGQTMSLGQIPIFRKELKQLQGVV
jgi:RsiW-degrading membrane proteinase PrsW (M82 family)